MSQSGALSMENDIDNDYKEMLEYQQVLRYEFYYL